MNKIIIISIMIFGLYACGESTVTEPKVDEPIIEISAPLE